MVLTPLEYGSVSIRLYPSIQSRQFISDFNCRPPPHYSFTAHSNFFFHAVFRMVQVFCQGTFGPFMYILLRYIGQIGVCTMTNTANCLQKVAERSKLLPDKINFPQHNSCKKIFYKKQFISRNVTKMFIKPSSHNPFWKRFALKKKMKNVQSINKAFQSFH